MYVFTRKCGRPICHIYNSGGTQTCNFSDCFFTFRLWLLIRPKNFGFNFSIFRNYWKSRQPAILEDLFPGIFVPFDCAAGISEIFGWMVRISEVQQFLDFFSENSVPFASISKVPELLIE